MTTTVGRPVERRGLRAVPGRGALLLGTLLVMIGAFLPWIETPLRGFRGIEGAGLWTFYVAWLGLAGVLVPVRRLAAVQAAILAATALVLPAWQIAHMLGLGVGFWGPGIGLVLTVAGGMLAGRSALLMLRTG